MVKNDNWTQIKQIIIKNDHPNSLMGLIDKIKLVSEIHDRIVINIKRRTLPDKSEYIGSELDDNLIIKNTLRTLARLIPTATATIHFEADTPMEDNTVELVDGELREYHTGTEEAKIDNKVEKIIIRNLEDKVDELERINRKQALEIRVLKSTGGPRNIQKSKVLSLLSTKVYKMIYKNTKKEWESRVSSDEARRIAKEAASKYHTFCLKMGKVRSVIYHAILATSPDADPDDSMDEANFFMEEWSRDWELGLKLAETK